MPGRRLSAPGKVIRVTVYVGVWLALYAVSQAGNMPKPRPGGAAAPVVRSDRAGPAMPTPEAVCRERLANFGVTFNRLPAIREDSGCVVAAPLAIHTIAPGVAIKPRTRINCRLAETLRLWVAGSVVPDARRYLGTELVAIRQNATYVCRTRNGVSGARMSEHAFGNAIDIRAFHFADGSVVEVGPVSDPAAPQARFLSAIRKAACGPFGTVLGPGADAHHEDHFHLDLATRRHTAYCR